MYLQNNFGFFYSLNNNNKFALYINKTLSRGPTHSAVAFRMLCMLLLLLLYLACSCLSAVCAAAADADFDAWKSAEIVKYLNENWNEFVVAAAAARRTWRGQRSGQRERERGGVECKSGVGCGVECKRGVGCMQCLWIALRNFASDVERFVRQDFV